MEKRIAKKPEKPAAGKKVRRTAAKGAPLDETTIVEGGGGAGATTGSEADYAHYLPRAMKVAVAEVLPVRTEIALLRSNARTGVAAVLEHRATIAKELPGVSLVEIDNLERLGSALTFAGGQVARFAEDPTEIAPLMARAHALRKLLLSSADALVAAGKIPPKPVAKIHEGHGGIDTAGDCVALAALFKKYAAEAKGKVPFGAAELKEAADVGTRLLAVLRPKAAGKKEKAVSLREATDARDRLWTLFEATWRDHVWRTGAWLFKREVDARVPALASRVVGKKAAAKATDPAAAAPVSPAPGKTAAAKSSAPS